MECSFLNYDRSKEEHDVWVNHIQAAHNANDWGLINKYDPRNNYVKAKNQAIKAALSVESDLFSSYKWTGKPSDDWNRVDENLKERVIS